MIQTRRKLLSNDTSLGIAFVVLTLSIMPFVPFAMVASHAAVQAPFLASTEDDAPNADASAFAPSFLEIQSDFEALGLEMMGASTMGADTSVYLRLTDSASPQIYQVGDFVGPFKISKIYRDATVFTRRGFELRLAIMSLKSGNDAPIMQSIVPKELVAQMIVPMKRGGDEVKRRIATDGNSEVVSLPRGWYPKQIASYSGPRFIMPVEGRVTSGYGYRKHPTGGTRRYHRGIDIAAAYGSRVLAAAPGKVIDVSHSWAKGLNILIEHNDGYRTAYFHLSRADVAEGEQVAQGQIIAREGSSGNSTGPHLHFEILKQGQSVNPALFLTELSGK